MTSDGFVELAIAASTEGDRPCSTSSVMIRALAGPTNSTSRSVPAATSSATGTGKPTIALAARLYPNWLRSVLWRAAMS
jgi:hypothetical protein